jgi:hypothetical protein
MGREYFWASTHETDPHKAFLRAAPWIAGWREQIEAARVTANDPLKAEIERQTKDYRRYRNKSLDDAVAAMLMDALDFIFQRQGGMTFAAQAKALTGARGDVAEALKSLPDPALAADTLARISGRATPMLAHLDQWKAATHLQGKTLDQCVVDIQQFNPPRYGGSCPVAQLLGMDAEPRHRIQRCPPVLGPEGQRRQDRRANCGRGAGPVCPG